MQARIEQFFTDYVACFNRALGPDPDLEGIRAAFAPCFVSASPVQVTCGENNASFTNALRQGYEFYRSIGTRGIRLREVHVTPIDDCHAMATVGYGSTYQRTDLEPTDIDFEVTYLLHFDGDTPLIFAFVVGDEMAALRKAGVVTDPSSTTP